MFTVSQLDQHLVGMGHGGTLNKVRNKYAMYERAASILLQKAKPVETIRTSALASTVHDDLNTYALPSDFNSLIDLLPQDNRTLWDKAFRTLAGRFDLEKALKNRTISIEGSEGVKVILINWKSRQAKVLNTMNTLTGNGTWSAVGTASGLVADEIVKRNGSGSIRFDVAATGDGIDNDDMNAVDLTDEDEVGDILLDLYIKNAADLANFNSLTAIWGNNVSSAFWTGTAQTAQADGTAFKVGWNTLKFPWSTATETGTVAPASIDYLKFTASVDAAISDLRIDNVRCSIGRAFDIKYYSKYLFKNSSGLYISQPTTDDDSVLIDNDSLPLLLMELLKAMAHQVEGVDSTFDLQYAQNELAELYPAFKSEHPDQRVKTTSRYSSGPRWNR